MKNARVTVDGKKMSMAAIIAMASDMDMMKPEKDYTFRIDPRHHEPIRTEMRQMYPNTIDKRVHFAQMSMINKYVGIWRGVKIYL